MTSRPFSSAHRRRRFRPASHSKTPSPTACVRRSKPSTASSPPFVRSRSRSSWWCMGRQSEPVAFGDMVIATPAAKFAQPEVKLGVFPPFAAVMLPQLIGPKKTYELILTGEALTAEEALRLGFVNKVVPESELDNAVKAILAKIAEFSGPVLEVTKKVIGGSIGLPLDEAMKKSQNIYLNELMNLQDVQEGLRAVLEKRKPVWKNK